MFYQDVHNIVYYEELKLRVFPIKLLLMLLLLNYVLSVKGEPGKQDNQLIYVIYC